MDFNGVSICCAQMPRFRRPPKLAITETAAADKANSNRGMTTNIDGEDDGIEVLDVDTEGEVKRAESKSASNKVTLGNKRLSGGEGLHVFVCGTKRID